MFPNTENSSRGQSLGQSTSIFSFLMSRPLVKHVIATGTEEEGENVITFWAEGVRGDEIGVLLPGFQHFLLGILTYTLSHTITDFSKLKLCFPI